MSPSPINSSPGAPHWIKPTHGLKGRGQGYDFHDNVSLQQATDGGGYDSGHAVNMNGEVTFEMPLLNIGHGAVYDLNLIRKSGTVGRYELWLEFDDTKSTGLIGEIRSEIEHGFPVTKIDYDITTLNPHIEQDILDPKRYKVVFEDGMARVTIKAIVTYRTSVRDKRAVVLQKPYTYWVEERYNVWAGDDERKKMVDEEPWKSDPTQLPGCEGTDGQREDFLFERRNIEVANDACFVDRHSPAYDYRPEVKQHWAWYQVKSLPLPEFFMDPVSVGSPAVAPYKDWVNVKSFWNHDNMQYTVGSTREVIAITRVYALSQGGTPLGRTGHPSLDVLPCCKSVTGRCEGDPKGAHFSRDPIWVGKIAGDPPDEPGYKGLNMHVVGLKDVWSNDFEFKWSPNNEYHSDYESYRVDVFNTTPADLWPARTYDYKWKTPEAGNVMMLGSKFGDIQLGSNVLSVMFNWIGTPMSTVFRERKLYAIDEAYGMNAGLITHGEAMERFPAYGFETWVGRTGGNYGWAPWSNFHGRGMTRGTTYPFGYNNIVDRVAEWYSRKPDIGSLFYHEPTQVGKTGRGEGGTSSTLYDISSLVHEDHTYDKNRDLRAYYMCCTDHVDKKMTLKLSKVNDADEIRVGGAAEHTVTIDKSAPYNVAFHARYDTNVHPNYGVPNVKVFNDYQSWEDEPSADSITKQLFVADGASVYSPVLFLSLTAGGNTGGSFPSAGIPALGKNKTTPVLITSIQSITETATYQTPLTVEVMYTNIGGDDAILSLDNDTDNNLVVNGFRSQKNLRYGPTTTGGYSGDKINDCTWEFEAGARVDTVNTNSVFLSANESVIVKYTFAAQSENQDGYNVYHPYTFNRGVLWGGPDLNKIDFAITY